MNTLLTTTTTTTTCTDCGAPVPAQDAEGIYCGPDEMCTDCATAHHRACGQCAAEIAR